MPPKLKFCPTKIVEKVSVIFLNLAEDVRRAESREHPRQAVRHGGQAERRGASAGPRGEALREGQERQGQERYNWNQGGHGGHLEIEEQGAPLRRRRIHTAR